MVKVLADKIEGKYILLEARSDDLKVWRFYYMGVQKDLFRNWCLLTRYGRKGTEGKQKEYIFSQSEDLIKKARQVFKKRLKATSRIGVNYAVVNGDLSLFLR